MPSIWMENLLCSDRPLTWRPAPCCEFCSLPFTNKPKTEDDPVHRQPFQLSCYHLLCDQCVCEYVLNGIISCKLCNSQTTLVGCNNSEDATKILHPSYYMLGVLERKQQELNHIKVYQKDAEELHLESGNTQPDKYITPLDPGDMKSQVKMKALLEKAYHSYEKSKHVLDKQEKAEPENVEHVVKKVNAHFTLLHNALQAEEDSVLRKVRQSFLEQRQQHERQQRCLKRTKDKLKQLYAQVKRFHETPSSSNQAWKTFGDNVKRLLESEPLKLRYEGGSKMNKMISFQEYNQFVKNISSSYKLTLSDAGKRMRLVPFFANDEPKPHQTDRGPHVVTPRVTNEEKAPKLNTSSSSHRSAKQQSDSRDITIVSRDRRTQNDVLRRNPRAIYDSHKRHDFKRMFTTVSVTHIVSPSEFYIQHRSYDSTASQKLDKLCKEEAEANEHAILAGSFQIDVQIGSLYLGRMNPSAGWYRVEVLDKLTEEGPFVVQSIDYGVIETIEHDQLRPISSELGATERKAVKCSLYGVLPLLGQTRKINPPGKVDWSEECIQLMKDFVTTEALLYQVDKTKDGLKVDLLLPPVGDAGRGTGHMSDMAGWPGYYAPMSLRSTLLYMQLCKPVLDARWRNEIDHIEQLERWMRRATEQVLKQHCISSAPELNENDCQEVHITHSSSPDHFHVKPSEWKTNEPDLLHVELEALCRQARSQSIFCPYVGLVCGFTVVNQAGNDIWLRGRVEKVLSKECEMYALDTGERLVVRSSSMRLLPAGCVVLTKHCLAVNCRLGHIGPKYANDGKGTCWSREAIDEFVQLTSSNTLRYMIKIIRSGSVGDVYSVLLYICNKSDRHTCVNGLLVSLDLAECSGSPEQIKDLMKQQSEVHELSADGSLSNSSMGGRVADPRTPIQLLKVVSPSEFYVRLSSRTADLKQLHQHVQDHMDEALDYNSDGDGEAQGNSSKDEENSGWSVGDMCVVFSSTSESGSSEWYRAQIVALLEQDVQYEAFLIDQAVKVSVHRTNIARLSARIGNVQPGAIRCRLACVEPLDEQNGWHQSSIDAFNGAIETFAKHAISLDVKIDPTASGEPQALHVVLWGLRESTQQALAPHKTEYRNINQLLHTRGLARISGRFRTFAIKGSAAVEELHSLEHAIDELLLQEYEKMQQFFRSVAAVSKDEPPGGATARWDGSEATKTVRMNGARFPEESAPEYAKVFALLEETRVERIESWPKAEPIEKTVFVGIPTSIGYDGDVFLYDVYQQPVLDRMLEVINNHVVNDDATGTAAGSTFQPGEPCLARFQLDGQFYRGTIVSIIGTDWYRVLFVDYGNIERCSGTDLRHEVVCGGVPIQTHSYRLCNIVPKNMPDSSSRWPEEAIDACHGLIVQKRVTIRVERSAKPSDVIPCRMQLITETIDVDRVLVDLGLFVHLPDQSARLCFNVKSSKPSTRPVSLLSPDPPSQPHRLSQGTPEQRDLLRFMEEIQAEYRSKHSTGDYEDPNEFVDVDDETDWLNRAQLIRTEPTTDANDELPLDDNQGQGSGSVVNSEQEQQSEDHSDELVADSPLPSPASFDSNEFDTSSRLSEDDQDQEADTTVRSSLSAYFSQLPAFDHTTKGFFAEYTNYCDEIELHVYPHLEGHTQRMARMSEKVQRFARSRNSMHHWQATMLEPGDPCLARFREDGVYYRAVIEAVDEGQREVNVLYVDYLNREKLPVADIRKCPRELRNIPLRNVQVRLAGLRPNPRMRVDDIAWRLVELLQRAFYVKIVRLPKSSETPVPEVELYTDFDCSKLVYQNMIDEKYFLRFRDND